MVGVCIVDGYGEGVFMLCLERAECHVHCCVCLSCRECRLGRKGERGVGAGAYEWYLGSQCGVEA